MPVKVNHCVFSLTGDHTMYSEGRLGFRSTFIPAAHDYGVYISQLI